MTGPKPSVMPTYNSRETGPRYHVTTKVAGRVIAWETPLPDPFVRTEVVVGMRDLLRALIRRRLTITVMVGGDPEMVNDVIELDDDALVTGRRRASDFRRTILDNVTIPDA